MSNRVLPDRERSGQVQPEDLPSGRVQFGAARADGRRADGRRADGRRVTGRRARGGRVESGRADSGRASSAEALSQQPIGELIGRASEQISTLVRDELRLARAELTSRTRRAGIGAVLLGAGAVLAGYAAALLVGGAVLILGLIVGLIGARHLRRAGPPAPAEAVRNVRADLDAVRGAVAAERAHAARGDVLHGGEGWSRPEAGPGAISTDDEHAGTRRAVPR
jgi:Putative Actinobacterial Holin-X, holin superfamily III